MGPQVSGVGDGEHFSSAWQQNALQSLALGLFLGPCLGWSPGSRAVSRKKGPSETTLAARLPQSHLLRSVRFCLLRWQGRGLQRRRVDDQNTLMDFVGPEGSSAETKPNGPKSVPSPCWRRPELRTHSRPSRLGPRKPRNASTRRQEDTAPPAPLRSAFGPKSSSSAPFCSAVSAPLGPRPGLPRATSTWQRPPRRRGRCAALSRRVLFLSLPLPLSARLPEEQQILRNTTAGPIWANLGRSPRAPGTPGGCKAPRHVTSRCEASIEASL